MSNHGSISSWVSPAPSYASTIPLIAQNINAQSIASFTLLAPSYASTDPFPAIQNTHNVQSIPGQPPPPYPSSSSHPQQPSFQGLQYIPSSQSQPAQNQPQNPYEVLAGYPRQQTQPQQAFHGAQALSPQQISFPNYAGFQYPATPQPSFPIQPQLVVHQPAYAPSIQPIQNQPQLTYPTAAYPQQVVPATQMMMPQQAYHRGVVWTNNPGGPGASSRAEPAARKPVRFCLF